MPPRTLRNALATMSTTDAAEALGVSVAMASLIRAGARAVTLRRLAAFVAKAGNDEIDIEATLAEEAAIADSLAEQRRAANGR